MSLEIERKTMVHGKEYIVVGRDDYGNVTLVSTYPTLRQAKTEKKYLEDKKEELKAYIKSLDNTDYLCHDCKGMDECTCEL